MPALTKRAVDAAKPKLVDHFLWCSSTPGFGVRVYPSGKRVFVCQVRVGRATRRIKIGVYGPYTVEQARQRAQEIIRAASEGRDPQREKSAGRDAITVSEMCEAYLEAARSDLVMTRFRRPKRTSTLKIDEGRVARHIKPLIGHLRETCSAWLTRSLKERPLECSKERPEPKPLLPAVESRLHALSVCSVAFFLGQKSGASFLAPILPTELKRPVPLQKTASSLPRSFWLWASG